MCIIYMPTLFMWIFYIITSNKQTTLNSRTELLNKCRHAKNSFFVISIKFYISFI